MKRRGYPIPVWILILLLCGSGFDLAHAKGRLLATGGASQLEGAAGGGLVPWAVLAGYGTRDEQGGTAFVTRIESGDYNLNSFGAAYTFNNRVEFSLARNEFALGTLGRALGLSGAVIRQDVFGVKYRLAGDLLYSELPQLAVGVQHKRNRDFAVPHSVGARDDTGTDFYLGASKLVLAGWYGRHVLLHAGVRASRANEIGILGFGGDRNDAYQALFEGSVGILLNRQLMVAAEYRQKPENLSFTREDDWADAFVAFFPNKRLALIAAYADLGTVASLPGQRAWYVSMQLSY